MEFAVRVFFTVLWSAVVRCFVPFLLSTVVLSLVIGVIAHLSGGDFMLGVKYGVFACCGVGAVTAVVATIGAR